MYDFDEQYARQLRAMQSMRSRAEAETLLDEDKSLFWASQHWVNNPTIDPVEKAEKFERSIKQERENAIQNMLGLLATHFFVPGEGLCACQLDTKTVKSDVKNWVKHVEGLVK
jgi:hypothetical protein